MGFNSEFKGLKG